MGRWYAELKARWRVNRRRTATFLVLWFLTAILALAYSDLNKLVYLKVEKIPSLLVTLAGLGYELPPEGLRMPYPEYHSCDFWVYKSDQEYWVNVSIYLPPRNRIEEVPRDVGSRLDLKSTTGSARLYYE